MSQAGSNAIFEFVQICGHGVKLVLGVIQPPNPRAPAGSRLPAIYRRIQAASPPPCRADKSEWTSGMLPNDSQALEPSSPSGDWENPGVHFADDVASLGQPPPGTIKLDQWLTLPAGPVKRRLTGAPEPLGFLSAPYPQPVLGADGWTDVQVDYNIETELLPWSNPPKPGDWVAFSFDRFWPPERESVEFIGRVQADCDCDGPTPAGQEEVPQARSGSA
jgi:hypothetical protein